jgi:hypothetical protein
MKVHIGDEITINETKCFVTGVREHQDGSFTLEFMEIEKQPKAGWVEYPIKRDDCGYHVVLGDKSRLYMNEAQDSPTCIGLFGGVQFEGQATNLWHMQSTQYMMGKTGYLYPYSLTTDEKPAVPTKARFWQEVK